MVPWCNRAPTTPCGGRSPAELPANFPDGSAIHGEVADAPWGGGRRVDAADRGRWRCLAVAVRRARPLPRRFHELWTDGGARNLDDAPMPAGIGLHVVRGCRAPPCLPMLTDNIAPWARPQPVEPPYDLRRLDVMADGLDATWTELTSNSSTSPAVAPAARCSGSARRQPSSSPPPRPTRTPAVEPQTHAPLALRRLVGHEPGRRRCWHPAMSSPSTTSPSSGGPRIHRRRAVDDAAGRGLRRRRERHPAVASRRAM